MKKILLLLFFFIAWCCFWISFWKTLFNILFFKFFCSTTTFITRSIYSIAIYILCLLKSNTLWIDNWLFDPLYPFNIIACWSSFAFILFLFYLHPIFILRISFKVLFFIILLFFFFFSLSFLIIFTTFLLLNFMVI